MKNFKKNQKGFTLVELLIVVVILGILAAVAIPRFMTSKKAAQTQSCRSNLASLQAKIEEALFMKSAVIADDGTIKVGDTPFTDVMPIDATDGLTVGSIAIIDADSFPNGIPVCPSGTADAPILYNVDSKGKVTCTSALKDHILGVAPAPPAPPAP